MEETQNHGYEVPEAGDRGWHEPLNSNIVQHDTDIEIRDTAGSLDTYEPTAGAKFFATDSGVIYVGDGDSWNEAKILADYEDGTATLATADEVMLDGADLEVDGDLYVTGTKHFVHAVDSPQGPTNVVYTAVEAAQPRTQVTGVIELVDNRVEIILPDHFQAVTSTDVPLSIQLTPYAQVPVQPQVVEWDHTRVVVADFGDSACEYSIAYTITGVRDGFEQVAPCQPE